jgi:hypothetical protein
MVNNIVLSLAVPARADLARTQWNDAETMGLARHGVKAGNPYKLPVPTAALVVGSAG